MCVCVCGELDSTVKKNREEEEEEERERVVIYARNYEDFLVFNND